MPVLFFLAHTLQVLTLKSFRPHLLENLEDNFEKKVDGLEELSAEVSCDEVGIPA